MAKVINSYGTEINYNAAVELMDDELREEVHADLAPCTEQEFFAEAPAATPSASARSGRWTSGIPAIEARHARPSYPRLSPRRVLLFQRP